MEKYARQAVSEGVQRSEDIHVNKDSEIYRVLNLHYNRNNHIEVSAVTMRLLTVPTTAFTFSFSLSLMRENDVPRGRWCFVSCPVVKNSL